MSKEIHWQVSVIEDENVTDAYIFGDGDMYTRRDAEACAERLVKEVSVEGLSDRTIALEIVTVTRNAKNGREIKREFETVWEKPCTSVKTS